ncbi:DEAD-domain-containing protein [Polychaeton citri CBS 116435]|uniref:ATP-dependent RNA helicase n=1 Tax=Polychaeton citri CBS 116435 TaxID=1314669 RepID=A0A9P4QDI8_9PEZI|nr:DEAD-domain-containing protein [Polychaeton citri CBS 116435]
MSRTIASGQNSGRTRPTKPKKQQRLQKRKRDDVDIEELEVQVQQLDPKATHTSFSDLPLSSPTQSGLKHASFSALTDIQTRAIPAALQGKDILGAAKTGSGKTLAFVVPILENLYRAQHVGQDAGLGAMVISPTRELAIQIYEVLRKVGGRGHQFSAGLFIGGKDHKAERDALGRMNILIGTPGRILHHLSSAPNFDLDNLQMLVLDEADRCMDMGFQKDIDAIIDYLPPKRQTLLFSATQSKRVSDLSRLALKDPEYIAVHDKSHAATPKTLQQNYVVTPLPDKLDTLWSFIQSSKKAKILVFFSSAKQVRFVFESFRHMQPGIPLQHLHGRQKQTARLDTVQKFSQMKHACLFSTDVAARGLDFPAVDWVVQVDCPEDADTYIHRVGRTARYERDGRAIIFLDPSEEKGMLARLEQKKVPIERINVRPKKQQSIKSQLQDQCFKDPQLKYLGQKAFISYAKSLRVQKDREVFDVQKYNLGEYAESMGLPGQPNIKFLKSDPEEVRRRKNAPRIQLSDSEVDLDEEHADDDEGVERRKAKTEKDSVRTKYDRMFERKNQDVFADHYAKIIHDGERNDVDASRLDGEQVSDNELFGVKRRIPASGEDMPNPEAIPKSYTEDGQARTIHIPGAKEGLVLDSKRREKLLKSKKQLLKLKESGKKLVFDDDGQAHEIYELGDEDEFRARGTADDQRRQFVENEGERVRLADIEDKALAKQKRKEKKDKRKAREREAEVDDGDDDDDSGVEGPTLGGNEKVIDPFADDYEGPGSQSSDSESGTGERGDDGPPRKKKWFENDKRAGRDGDNEHDKEIETFDDLEAEAARLLG